MDDDVMTAEKDDATNRRLQLLVGLVVVLGVAALVAAVLDIVTSPELISPFRVLLTCLIAAANFSGVQVRIRASNVRFSGTSAAALMATAVAPVGWIVLGMAAGVLLSSLKARLSFMKLAFNVAKESLVGAAAGAVMIALNAPPVDPTDLASKLPGHLVVMPLAAAAYAIVDEALFFPVIALATGTSTRQRFKEHWDVRLLSRVGGLVMGMGATVVITIDQWLLLALPPLLYALHLASAGRRARP